MRRVVRILSALAPISWFVTYTKTFTFGNSFPIRLAVRRIFSSQSSVTEYWNIVTVSPFDTWSSASRPLSPPSEATVRKLRSSAARNGDANASKCAQSDGLSRSRASSKRARCICYDCELITLLPCRARLPSLPAPTRQHAEDEEPQVHPQLPAPRQRCD